MKRSFAFTSVFLVLLLMGLPTVAEEKDRTEPFTFVDMGFCPFGHCGTRELDTPAGTRMVIETFSMAITAADGADVGSVSLRQVTEDQGTNVLHLAPVVGPNPLPNVTGAGEFLASQQVRVYPDPTLPVILAAESEDEQATFTATISGHFVPLKSRTLSLGSASP